MTSQQDDAASSDASTDVTQPQPHEQEPGDVSAYPTHARVVNLSAIGGAGGGAFLPSSRSSAASRMPASGLSPGMRGIGNADSVPCLLSLEASAAPGRVARKLFGSANASIGLSPARPSDPARADHDAAQSPQPLDTPHQGDLSPARSSTGLVTSSAFDGVEPAPTVPQHRGLSRSSGCGRSLSMHLLSTATAAATPLAQSTSRAGESKPPGSGSPHGERVFDTAGPPTSRQMQGLLRQLPSARFSMRRHPCEMCLMAAQAHHHWMSAQTTRCGQLGQAGPVRAAPVLPPAARKWTCRPGHRCGCGRARTASPPAKTRGGPCPDQQQTQSRRLRHGQQPRLRRPGCHWL